MNTKIEARGFRQDVSRRTTDLRVLSLTAALMLAVLMGCSSTSYSTTAQMQAPRTIRSPAIIPPELVPYAPRFIELLQAQGFQVGWTEDPKALDLLFEFNGNPFNLRASAGLSRQGIPILTASATNSGWGTALACGSAIASLAEQSMKKFKEELYGFAQ